MTLRLLSRSNRDLQTAKAWHRSQEALRKAQSAASARKETER